MNNTISLQLYTSTLSLFICAYILSHLVKEQLNAPCKKAEGDEQKRSPPNMTGRMTRQAATIIPFNQAVPHCPKGNQFSAI